jgi:mannose-6-phosphate isomerase
MTPLYPLRFQPLLRRYLWGGRRLQSVLGKELPPGDDYAESWELCDRAGDQSLVAKGPLTGTSLAQLVAERGGELLGRHHPQVRFPLLFKFLDAHRSLSVQVHPNDAQAACLDPPDLGKTEAWVVVHADPGSLIYAGLKPGVDRAALADAIARGTCHECLLAHEARAGDCYFLPAGTVHALGAGLVIAELQQSSDCTYRLFDWNRVGTDGKPRPLHIEEALAVIDFDAEPIRPQRQEPAEPQPTRLVACDKFVLERYHLVSSTARVGGDERCRLLAVLDGRLMVEGEPQPVEKGQTVLLPAVLGSVTLRAADEATFLCAQLP